MKKKNLEKSNLNKEESISSDKDINKKDRFVYKSDKGLRIISKGNKEKNKEK